MAEMLAPAAWAMARVEVRAKPCSENSRSASPSRRSRASWPSLRAGRAGSSAGRGGIQGDHDAGLQHEINRLIEIPAIRSD
ncbi:hypothetical protein [Brachymonas denitrificans]|uniref:hypothetical protein n=1 Tax=Brachymonas denitrificans TaxID=28220 RepID=UPI002AFF29BF|nr:hypothetical protein [Brachymonas denitrificans]